MELLPVSTILASKIPCQCFSCGLWYNDTDRKPLIICGQQHMSCPICLNRLRIKSDYCPECKQILLPDCQIKSNRIIEKIPYAIAALKEKSQQIIKKIQIQLKDSKEHQKKQQLEISQLKKTIRDLKTVNRVNQYQLTILKQKMTGELITYSPLQLQICPHCGKRLKLQKKLIKKSSNKYHNQKILIMKYNWNETKLKLKQMQINLISDVIIKYAITCQQVIQELKTMINLKNLRIQWNPLGKKKWILKILQNLPNLISLYFDCSDNQFDQQCCIYATKLINLQNLYYGIDIDGGMQYLSQSPFFRQSEQKQIRWNSLSWDQTYRLAQKLPKLRNIWIGKCEFLETIIQIKKWKYLAIGNIEDQILNNKNWDCLIKIQQLISIAFINIDQINNQKLSLIIKNNCRTLISLMIHYCQGLTQQGMKTLNSCSQLKILNLKLDYRNQISINGTFLSQHKLSLITNLYLHSCKTMIVAHIWAAFRSMANIQSLALCRNDWVNDNLLQLLKNRINLRHLNLEYCQSVTDKGFQVINTLKLTTLHVGGTHITIKCLLQIISNLSQLQKLGLSYLPITQEILIKIGQQLQQLTHINVSWCKQINGESLSNSKLFPNLKFITGFNTPISNDFIIARRNDLLIFT